MQEDITTIATWSLENKLPISLPKFALLLYRNKNIRRKYTLFQQVICSINSCPDLGILRSNLFSYDDHIRATALRDMRLMGILMKAFETRKPEFLFKVFKSYVRPVLEYASQVWSPSGVTFSCSLEKVQRKFTKLLRGAFGLNYEQRLISFQLSTLKTCRFFMTWYWLSKLYTP